MLDAIVNLMPNIKKLHPSHIYKAFRSDKQAGKTPVGHRKDGCPMLHILKDASVTHAEVGAASFKSKMVKWLQEDIGYADMLW